MTRSRPAKMRSTLARCVLAAALVGTLWWLVGPAAIRQALAQADEVLLALAFATIFAYSAVRAWTWQQLLVGLGLPARSFKDVLGCYATGGLLGTVIPSTAGTDAVRAMLAKQRFGGPLAAHLAAIVVLNAASWLAACVLGLIALATLGGDRFPGAAVVVAPIFAGVVAALLSVHWLLRYSRARWLALLRKWPFALRRLRRPLRRFASSLLVFERARVRLGPVFASTFLAQFGVAGMLFLTGTAVGVELDYLSWAVFAPLVSMVAFVPASVSGFGADQVAFVYGLGIVAVSPGLAFAASTLGSGLKLLFNLVGGGLALVLQPIAYKNLSHNQ